jgi:S1-C subfamily serine protease
VAGTASSTLTALSAELSGVVERVAPSVVRVDDGSRLTASGLIWSGDGIIVTSSHGVERDEKLAIELADGARLPAAMVGRDPEMDLAVLRVSASGLAAVQPAAPGDVRVGHLVLALGRPGTWGLHATIGIVSARMDTEKEGEPGYILHTDAVLYPGFSGGALADMSGRLVGLTNLRFGRGKGVAIGTPVVRQVAEALLDRGSTRRGFLGISTQPGVLPAALRESLNLSQERALVVVQVQGGGPAEQGGVMLGDLLLGINDNTLQDVDDLVGQLRRLRAGQSVTLRIARGGERRDMSVTLGG